MKFRTRVEVQCEAGDILDTVCEATTEMVLLCRVRKSNLGSIGASGPTVFVDTEHSTCVSPYVAQWKAAIDREGNPPYYFCPQHAEAGEEAVKKKAEELMRWYRGGGSGG
jgi:hypothetical protein